MSKEDQVDRPDDKTFSIVVNGRAAEVDRDELSFDELVDLAFDDPARGPQIVFTITFREAGGRIPDEGAGHRRCFDRLGLEH